MVTGELQGHGVGDLLSRGIEDGRAIGLVDVCLWNH